MLRPTQSAIIFVQQLGRGLRKAEGKEYVVVLDFIGNYSNNFLIPIALSGDRTYNKDTVRKYVREGARVIPGASTIHFDEVTKKRIFESIDKMTTTKRMLTDKYNQVKYKLGRIPTILDFYKLGEIDPMLFIKYAKTYDGFLRIVDKDYDLVFTEKEERILAFISALVIDGKRPHELIMLKMMANNMLIDEDNFANELKKIGEKYEAADYHSAKRMLQMEFVSGSDANKFADIELISKETSDVMGKNNREMIIRAASFMDKLSHIEFRRELENLIEYGMLRYNDIYKNHDKNNMVLYEKYSRKVMAKAQIFTIWAKWKQGTGDRQLLQMIRVRNCPL